jgi:hypothetical protein
MPVDEDTLQFHRRMPKLMPAGRFSRHHSMLARGFSASVADGSPEMARLLCNGSTIPVAC